MQQFFKIFFIAPFLFFIGNNGIGQNSLNNVNNFLITQTILPGGTQYEYEFKNGLLTVYEIPQDYNTKYPSDKKKPEYCREVTSSQIASIDSIINKADIMHLDTSYSSATIDGVYWIFLFQMNGKEKKVYLDNYYLVELDTLLKYLNSILPIKERLITFDFVHRN